MFAKFPKGDVGAKPFSAYSLIILMEKIEMRFTPKRNEIYFYLLKLPGNPLYVFDFNKHPSATGTLFCNL